MKALNPLQSERGSSVVEFLICAPILAMLAYASYDLNRRIENQQTVTIAARNTVLLGSAFSQSQLNDSVKKQLDIEGQILDQVERQKVVGGLYVNVTANQKLGQAETDRIKGVTGFNTSGGQSSGSSFDTMSDTTGSLGAGAATTVQTMQDVGENLGLFIPDGMRTAGVETKADGSTNAIQSAIGVLARATTNKDDAQTAALDVERRFGDKFYFRQESGYHPNGHDDFAWAAIAMGVTKSSWGGGSDFGDDKGEIQPRCMTRLYGSNKCGSGGSHDFHGHVTRIADFKLVLSGVFFALETFPLTKAAGYAANLAVQTATIIPLCLVDAAVNRGGGVVNSVLGAVDKGRGGFDSNVMPKLQSPDAVNNFSSSLSPDQFKKKAGG